MGYFAHDAVIVTTNDYWPETLPNIEEFRESLPEEWRPLVIGPVSGVVNGYITYAFLPDGSKEGWDDSDLGDDYRRWFADLFKTEERGYPDKVSIRFGGDTDAPSIREVEDDD